ncbi:MAG: HD domain-containing phosphohydrolase [Tepidisphaerales bacterium]
MTLPWLEHLATATAVLDASGRIHLANRRLAALIGEPLERLVGRTLLPLYADESDRQTLTWILEAAARLPDGAVREEEFVLPRADGSLVPVLMAARRLEWATPSPLPSSQAEGRDADHAGERTGAGLLETHEALLPTSPGLLLVSFTDITRLKEQEAALREHFKYVAQLSDVALEQALALKRRSQAAELEAESLRGRESELRERAEQLADLAHELETVNRELERRVAQRTAELRQANLDAICMLAVAAEAKDHDTGDHVRRLRRLAERTARHLGFSEADAYDIGLAAVLHDVGKLHVPDSILSKPGPLTDDERRLMQQHTLWGQRILPDRPFFTRARLVARSHHENVDGSGYPDGLSGGRIPVEARIVHVADVYDALVSPRVYKPAWPSDRAWAELRRHSAVMFDPEVLEAFSAAIGRSGGHT